MSWEKVRLGDVMDLQNGYAFSSEDYVDNSEVYNCRMSNIRPGGIFDIDYNPRFLPNDYAEKYSQFLLKNGDIIVAMTDLANDPKILGVPTIITGDKKILLNQRVGKLIIGDKEKVFIPFLKYALNRKQVQKYFSKFSNGGLQINLGKNDLLSYEIELPPIATQKRIADILDTADALRRKDQELLTKYDQLAQAIFIDMFGDPVKNEKGWEVKKLGEVTLKIGSGSTPTGGKTAYKEKGISLIRSMNVYDFAFKYKDLAYIDDIQAKKLNNVEVKSMDILFNITGASVCRCSIVPDKILPARVNQHVSIIRVKDDVLNPIFLNHLLVSNQVKNNLLGIGAGGGAVMEAITKDQLENFEIIIPDFKLQNEFEQRIKLLDAQKSIQQNSHSTSLFSSLIQQAFNGTLVS
jgi:type I restriction enzyme S subunit